MKYFCYDETASKTTIYTSINRNTINKIFNEKIVRNCGKEELMPIIQGKILEGLTINTDCWKAYYGLTLKGYTHHRVFH